MQITSLQINHLQNPLGFFMPNEPVLSYKIENAKGTHQTSSQIKVFCADTEIYNSQIITQRKAVYPLPIQLKPRTKYTVEVSVTSNENETAVAQTYFETGKMNEAFAAKWITKPQALACEVPTLYKQINTKSEIKSARFYIACMGLYSAKINGNHVDDERLTPYCNDYSQWMQIITHDVTKALSLGENTLEITLANGWYKGRFALEGKSNIYGDTLAAIGELHIEYANGTVEIIPTDDTWQAKESVFDSAEIYNGAAINYAKTIANGQNVVEIEPTSLPLQDRLSPKVCVQQTMPVQSVFTTPKGEICLDMGQNMVGWLRVDTSHFKNSDFTLRFFEVLDPEKNVYLDNLRSAKQAFTYKTDGKARVVEPEFTFYGFRYVWVSGIENVDANAFTGCVVHSSMEQTGEIVTSNPQINRLFLNALWGQKGNFVDTPTDCPQRDERLGWTGDAQVFCGTAAFNMDTAAFFAKYMYDIQMEQKRRNGSVPHFVPSFEIENQQGISHSSCAWGDVATVIPWTLYVHTGDTSLLKAQYPSMKAWLEYIRRNASENNLWDTGFHFGDWLALDTPRPERPLGTTPNALVASAYYMYSATLCAKAAKALGELADAQEYEELAQKIKQAIQAEFITKNGRVASDTQTANVLALFMDFATDKPRAAMDLNIKVASNDMHLNTGFVGTAYLCRTLSDNGFNDTAWNLLTKSDYPSWLYEVKMGATTIWERWNSIKPDGSLGDVSMNSYNHYAYGAVVEWMYRNAAGLQPVEDGSGCANMVIAPQPNKRLQKMAAKYEASCGVYRSEWEITQNSLEFTFEIPFNGNAKVILPSAPASVMVNGEKISYENSLSLTAGIYKISYAPTETYYSIFDANSAISDVLESPTMSAWLKENVKGFAQLPHYLFLEAPKGSVIDFMNHFAIEFNEETQQKMKTALQNIRAWDLN